MPNVLQLILKLAFASTVSAFLCANACLYSYASYYEQSAEGMQVANGVGISQSMAQNGSDGTGDTGSQISANNDASNNADANENNQQDKNVVPDGVPAAIGQTDGSVYTYQEEIQDEDGKTSYVYSDGNDVVFDDGGLGEAEIIVN